MNMRSSGFGILLIFGKVLNALLYKFVVFGDFFCDIAVFVNFFAVMRCSEPPMSPSL